MVHALWYAVAAAKVAVILRLMRDGLMLRYPAFSIFMLANTARSLVLMFFGGASFGSPYRELFQSSLPVMLALQAVAVTEAIVLVCRNFPGFRSIALPIYGAFVAISAASIWFTAPIGAIDWAAVESAMALTIRHLSAALLVLVLLTLRFFGQRGLRMSRNAKLHSRLFALVLATDMIAWAVYQMKRGPVAFSQTVLLTGWLVSCCAWACLLNRAGEQRPQLDPQPSADLLVPVRRARSLLEDIR